MDALNETRHTLSSSFQSELQLEKRSAATIFAREFDAEPKYRQNSTATVTAPPPPTRKTTKKQYAGVH